jgi:hypothetical protein
MRAANGDFILLQDVPREGHRRRPDTGDGHSELDIVLEIRTVPSVSCHLMRK